MFCVFGQMYGRFKTKELQQFAKDQAARLRLEQKLQKEKQDQDSGTFEADDIFHTYNGKMPGSLKSEFISYYSAKILLGASDQWIVVKGPENSSRLICFCTHCQEN